MVAVRSGGCGDSGGDVIVLLGRGRNLGPLGRHHTRVGVR